MTVKELLHALRDVDPDRMVYVPEKDGRIELVAAIVGLKHLNVLPGIFIPDDVALLPASLVEESTNE